MTAVSDLDTPVVIVHLDVMEDNIRRAQAHLDRHGIANRPHIKAHKIPAIGRMQMEAGWWTKSMGSGAIRSKWCGQSRRAARFGDQGR